MTQKELDKILGHLPTWQFSGAAKYFIREVAHIKMEKQEVFAAWHMFNAGWWARHNSLAGKYKVR